MQKKFLPLVVLSVGSLALSGCATGNAGAGGESDGISIVASTDVWGDIASVVAGDRAEVSSIIDSPDKDPHEYEATSRDQLAISRADIVIENGGGYDPFVDTLIDASGSTAHVISAVDASGLAPEDDHSDEAHSDEAESSAHAEDEHGDEDGHEHIEGFNEHVWYDLPTAAAVADRIADELAELDPEGADGYRSRAADFDAKIADLESEVAAASAADSGIGVLITEPVPLYLLEAMGLKNLTPESFSEAVEEDSDVSPSDLQTVLGVISDGEAALLAYNEQASTSQTETVRSAAEAAGVPVVDFSETLPEGKDYLGWMQDNVSVVTAALAK